MSSHYVEIGLGYDPLINDYKHLRLVVSSPKPSQTVYSIAVYTLGIGSWRMIQFRGKGSSNWCWCHLTSGDKKKVCFSNGLYSLAKKQDSACELVSFDLSSELFAFTSLPEPKSYGKKDLMFVDGGSSLALIRYHSSQVSIWVLEMSKTNAEEMYWTKRCSFALTMMEDHLYFKKNGDVWARGEVLQHRNPQGEAATEKPCSDDA